MYFRELLATGNPAKKIKKFKRQKTLTWPGLEDPSAMKPPV